MADINVKKKKNNRWPILVLIALVLGFVVIQLVLLDDTEEQAISDEIDEQTETVDEVQMPDEQNRAFESVDEYVVFVSENDPDDTELFVGDYISSAMDRLTEALTDLSETEEVKLHSATLDQLREHREMIANAEGRDKAVLVKKAFNVISQSMRSIDIQDNSRLQAEIQALDEMPDMINVETDIEEQDQAVSQFLEQTAIVLELIESQV
ncbi:MAG: hypothetical protein ACLFUB_08675 [Cyclobacteriaceae bacterium]